MTLPVFDSTDDPGASFHQLLDRMDLGPAELARRMSGVRDLSSTPSGAGSLLPSSFASGGALQHTHATTIVAMRYRDGVVMAGDRRATAGNVIAHRSMEKVFPADKYSGVSISGVAGLAAEMVKLFQLELEHYEKVEGAPLSLDGKATRLANMIRSNLPMAMQAGMVVIPIFAGYDTRRRLGRIYNYDITGGRYEELEFHATGSGGTYARALIKQQWRPDIDRATALRIAVSALFEAADEDSATGGPDSVRGIYPTVATITADGYADVSEADVAAAFDAVLAEQRAIRGGSVAALPAPTASAPTAPTAAPATKGGRAK